MVRKSKEKTDIEPSSLEQICIDIKDYTCLFADAKLVMNAKKNEKDPGEIDFKEIFAVANAKKYQIFELIKKITPEETVVISEILQESSKELKGSDKWATYELMAGIMNRQDNIS